jgi:EAL domain-containing protein (putative c-di-GMP-specific phosphodiesterase class I)
LQCHLGQGFLFAKPLAPLALADLLRSRTVNDEEQQLAA